MVVPLVLRKTQQFVPFTNRPPSDLAEYLAHEVPIHALLLDNPDISTLLFTTSSRAPTVAKGGTEKLDFTSTHHEPAIIARNVLLLAGLVRSSEATDETLRQLWAIHFHFLLDESALQLLENICSELAEASTSSSVWDASPFGQAGIRVCTADTLDELRLVWQQYLTMIRKSDSERGDFKGRFMEAAAAKLQNSYDPARGVIPVQVGVAAGGPLWREFLETGTSRDLYTDYWSTGMISGWKVPGVTFANPTFAVSSSAKTFPLHHAAEPCHGFDLGKALAATSSHVSSLSLAQHCAEFAREQFSSWSRAVCHGLTAGRIFVRFFAGDAIFFCHALQQSGEDKVIFTTPWSTKILALNERDYLSQTSGAPRRFATIDASHVADEYGLVTTLLCCEPLLEQRLTQGVLYTQTILQHAAQAPADFLQALGADASFLSLFLGLAPKSYLDGFAHPADAADVASARASTPSTAISAHLAWVRSRKSDSHRAFTCNGQELASLLYEVMVRLSRYEDIFEFARDVDSSRYKVLCTRETFVDLLVRVNHSVPPQIWKATIQKFISLCTNRGDPRNQRRLSSYQDLVVRLFLRGIDFGLLAAESAQNIHPLRKDQSPLRGWLSPTLVVYATIVVSRARLKKLRKVLKESDLDIALHGVVNYNPTGSASNFYSVSATFGTASQTQSSTGGNVNVELASTRDGIAGDAELVVSFCIPGWLLMRGQPETSVGIQVHFALSAKQQNIVAELGPELLLDSIQLSKNSPRMMFSRAPPQINGRRWGMQLAVPPLAPAPLSLPSLDAAFSVLACSVKMLTARVPVPVEARDAWQAKQPVSIQQASPTQLDIVTKDVILSVQIPLPVDVSVQRSKVARQSMYLETTLPVVRASGLIGRSPGTSRPPILPRVSLEDCWSVDAMSSSESDWFTAHLAATYTDAELATTKAGNPAAWTPLLHFKRWLQTLFVHSRTVLSNGPYALSLSVTGSEHRHVLLVHAILVDPNTRAVILDALYLDPQSLTPDHVASYDTLLEKTETFGVSLDAPVLACWTHLLPAYAERIRTTAHTEACSVALAWQNRSLLLGEDATRTHRLCACLCGVDASLVIDEWKPFAPFFTRLAISPLFASPCFDVTGGNTNPLGRPNAGEGNATDSGGGMIGSCARCGKTNMKLLKCGRCKIVAYCSKECQTVHWRVHKTNCQKPK